MKATSKVPAVTGCVLHEKGVKVYLTLERKSQGVAVSLQGEVWRTSTREPDSCGQITLSDWLEPMSAKAARISELWGRWHLNDMRAGCDHQRAAWNTTEPLEVVSYRLTSDAYRIRVNACAEAARCALAGEPLNLGATARALAELTNWYSPRFSPPDADSPLSGCYEVEKRETKTAGWVLQSEHPRGLLSKPCEVCGYKYGSAWLFEPVPDSVLAEMISWLASDMHEHARAAMELQS